MTIAKIAVWDFRVPFRDGSYAMSHVTQEVIFGRILQVCMVDGKKGLGEIVFPPSLLEQARHDLISDEENYLADMIGKEAADLILLAGELRDRGHAWGAVAFGLETAAFDLLGQERGCLVSACLGGAQMESVADYFSISEQKIEDIQARVSLAGSDRQVIQLKLGIGSLDDDADQIDAALDAMSSGQILLADANGGWTVEEARELISRFDDPRIVWEEPARSYEENTEVAKHTNRPVMVDQCVGEISIARRAIDEGYVSSLCIKPAFLGGLTVAREVRDYCTERGMTMRIDGPWCGDIATAAILHLAVGAPTGMLIAGCDLREPLEIDSDLKGVIDKGSTRIAPPPGVGLGVTLPDGALGEAEAVYR